MQNASSRVANRAFVIFFEWESLLENVKIEQAKNGSAGRVKSLLVQKESAKQKQKQVKQRGEPVFTDFYLIFCHSPQPPLVWKREFLLKYLTVTWASLMAKREKENF